MTTDFSSPVPPANEAAITALLLGELAPAESAEISAQLEADPELALLYERLRQTLALVAEASVVPVKSDPCPRPQVRFSNLRRNELLSAFKIVAPVELERKPRRGWMYWLRIAAGLAFLAGLAGLSIPNFVKARHRVVSSASSNQRAPALGGAFPKGLDREADFEAKPEQAASREPIMSLTPTSAGDRARRPSVALGEERSDGLYLPSAPAAEPFVEQASVAVPPSRMFDDTSAPVLSTEGRSTTDRDLGEATGLGRRLGESAIHDADSKPQATPYRGMDVLSELEASPQPTGATDPAGKTDAGPAPPEAAQPRATSAVMPAMMSRYGLVPSSIPETKVSKPPEELAARAQATSPPPAPSSGTAVPPTFNRNLARIRQEQQGLASAAKTRGETMHFDAPSPESPRGAVAFGGVSEQSRVQSQEGRNDGFGTGVYFLKETTDGRRVDDAAPRATAELLKQELRESVLTLADAKAVVEQKEVGRQSAGKPVSTGMGGAEENLKRREYRLGGFVGPDGLEKSKLNDTSRETYAFFSKDGGATPPPVFSNVSPLKSKPQSNLVADPLQASSSSPQDLALTRVPALQTPTDRKSGSKAVLAKKAALDLTVADSKDKEAAPPIEASPVPEPQPEQVTLENALSTFSLNVSDVSFKLAAASLGSGNLPPPGSVRSEEFINAFDYRDPQPSAGSPIGFAWERARYAFGHNQDLLRFSVKTAALGREPGRPYNLVLLLDNSGSMERADRVGIIHEILGALASQLRPQDRVSVVAFARTARLWADALPGSQAGELVKMVGNLTPEGGTNLEEALRLGYETALRHFMPQGMNRVILLTDGAANLGETHPEALQRQVESHRKRGVALDCFGIGWEGYNDPLLELLSRHGDGRYGFVNSAEEASTGFVNQLAGALHVAAADVKVQVEFNPLRVPAWRQIGYAKHQLKKEQFRDNTVDAAELAAAEAGNALYVAQINPQGEGGIGVVRARFREPSTGVYRELEWPVPYSGGASTMEQSSPAMRLAGTSALFAEWLATSPYAAEVTVDRLQLWLRNVADAFSPDARPRQLETMLGQARAISGR